MSQMIASLRGDTKPLALSPSSFWVLPVGRDNVLEPTLVFKRSREPRPHLLCSLCTDPPPPLPSGKIGFFQREIFWRLTLLTLFTANGENFSIFTSIDKIFGNWPFYAETAKQSVFLRIQVRANSQTKGLERGWKQRARLGRDARRPFWTPWSERTHYSIWKTDSRFFSLASQTLTPHFTDLFTDFEKKRLFCSLFTPIG